MNIKTKLHFLAECSITASSTVRYQDIITTPGQPHRGIEHPTVAKMVAAASYVIDSAVLELLNREDVSRSISAIIEADIARLPMNPMVIEFEPIEGYHDFVYLEEHLADDGIQHILAWVGLYFAETKSSIVNDFPLPFMIRHKQLVVPEIQMGHILEDTSRLSQRTIDTAEETKLQLDNSVASAIIAIELAFLMLNTKGIEKEIIQVTALNKHREKKGKVRIPTHTVVHIGTIYRRDGSAIRNIPGATGRHMPMHFRQAYTRRQHFGPENSETKMIFIPACIVNFVPDEQIIPKRRLIKV